MSTITGMRSPPSAKSRTEFLRSLICAAPAARRLIEALDILSFTAPFPQLFDVDFLDVRSRDGTRPP